MCSGDCEKCGGVFGEAGQQEMEVACKCQYSNVGHLLPRARCITRIPCKVCIILPQLLIEVLHWMVELGRLDICLEHSLLSSHLALLRVRHFENVLQVFSYFKKVTIQSSSMTPASLLLMTVSSRGGTVHPASLSMWMGKRTCKRGCQNQGVWVS